MSNATQAMTLAEFLLARIAEDEVRATIYGGQWHTEDCESVPQVGSEYTYPCDCGAPERQRREAEAKRRIVDYYEHGDDIVLYAVLEHLAAVYSDHPDFRDEWRP